MHWPLLVHLVLILLIFEFAHDVLSAFTPCTCWLRLHDIVHVEVLKLLDLSVPTHLRLNTQPDQGLIQVLQNLPKLLVLLLQLLVPISVDILFLRLRVIPVETGNQLISLCLQNSSGTLNSFKYQVAQVLAILVDDVLFTQLAVIVGYSFQDHLACLAYDLEMGLGLLLEHE